MGSQPDPNPNNQELSTKTDDLALDHALLILLLALLVYDHFGKIKKGLLTPLFLSSSLLSFLFLCGSLINLKPGHQIDIT